MASPYKTPVTPIKDVLPYFEKKPDGSMVFTGESLELRIPMRFQTYGALIISDQVTTIGIMDMIFDNQYQAGLNLLGTITISPSDQGKFTYQGIDYLVLYLKKGDVFISNTTILQNNHIVYILWSEFITRGNPIYTLDYPAMLALFENVKELTGQGIGVSRSVYEGIVAYIARDPDNIAKQYRLTTMSKPMKLVALSSISQASGGTISRLNGSYFKDEGLTSALRYQVDQQQPFENLLRGNLNELTNTSED